MLTPGLPRQLGLDGREHLVRAVPNHPQRDVKDDQQAKIGDPVMIAA